MKPKLPGSLHGPLSRRQFIAAGSGLFLAVGGIGRLEPSVLALQSDTDGDGSTLSVRLIRSADQLDVLLEFENVALDRATNRLEQVGAGPALMRVGFGAQHTVEDALDLDVDTPSTAALGSRTAGPSVVVTTIPTPLDFTVGALLGTASWAVRTAAEGETALELPAGLQLAPAERPVVTATGDPQTEEDVTELWRLGLGTGTGRPLDLVATANVAPVDGVHNPVPSALDRTSLVAQTGGSDPARARRLELSSHGAFARLTGSWPAQGLEHWQQTIVTGRDVVAEVIAEAYLLPFGHPVKILAVNSRSFLQDDLQHPVAPLTHELYLSIDEPTVDFDDAADPAMGYRPHEGRGLPFTDVAASPTEWIPITLSTVDDVDDVAIVGVSDVLLDGTEELLPVEYTATDRAGATNIGFATGATIVDRSIAFDTSAGSPLDRLTTLMSSPGSEWRRTIDLGGQTVAFADEVTEGAGATTFPTNTMQLDLEIAVNAPQSDLEGSFRLGAFPAVETARIVDEVVGELDVSLHDRWIQFGLDPATNFDLAFLSLEQFTERAVGSAARAVAALDLAGDILNQTVGIGREPTDDGLWNALEALGDSKLLGLVPLTQIVPDVDLAAAVPGLDIPGLDVAVDENGLKATFTFTPAISSVESLGFEVRGNDPRLFVENVTCVPVDGEPDNTLTIRVDDVTVQIPPYLGLVELDFSRVEVVESTSDGLVVDPRLEDWRWGGFLTWLKPLTDLLDALGGGIDISPTALELSNTAPLPAIKLGVVSISNVAIHSELDLPFTGDLLPEVGLGLGSASQPVEITVLGYGAEFYLEVDISPGGGSGLRRLTASVELDAKLFGIDIVVASADVTLRVSALFKLQDGDVTFRGSVAIEGNIEVLGLLDVSLGLVASVTYRSDKEKIKLDGRITYSVDTFLGGASGSIPIGNVSFELGGGGGGAAGLRSGAAPAAHGLRAAPAVPAVPAARGLRAVPAAAPAPPAPDTSDRPPSFGDRFTLTEWQDEYTAAFAA